MVFFFGVKNFFSKILILKMDVKMNLTIITKNHAADPEIRFLTKSISKPYGRATAMPPAWRLNSGILKSTIEIRFSPKTSFCRKNSYGIPKKNKEN